MGVDNDRDEIGATLTGAPSASGDEQADKATVMLDDDSTRVVSGLFCPICGGRFPGGLANCTTDGTPLVPVGTGDDLSGTVLRDKYVLVQRIGQGGFGQVYRATHRMARADVAVKVIRDELRENPKARRQFLKEARALMRIQSRHAVAVHDVDEDEAGRMYVAMEFLRGQNLEEHMKLVAPENRRLKWDETARIVIQICDALEDAHDQGIVHRDLKPANVMMVEGRNGKLQAKVVDFGIASLAQAGDSDLTSMDNIPKVIGTPSFMSPEQARGLSVTHKSDLYSLGAMMYRMVCGCRPFEAKTDQGMLIAHVMEQPPSIRARFPELDVPAAFDELVTRMMNKKPEERPADAAEVADVLKAMLPGEDGAQMAKGAGSGRKIWPLVVVIVGLVLAAGGAAAWFLTSGGAGVAVQADVVVEPSAPAVQQATDQVVPPSSQVQGGAVPVQVQPGVIPAPVQPARAVNAPVQQPAQPVQPAVNPAGAADPAAVVQTAPVARTGTQPAAAVGTPPSTTAPAKSVVRTQAASETAAPAPEPVQPKTPPPPQLKSSEITGTDVKMLNSMGGAPTGTVKKPAPGQVGAADDDDEPVESEAVKKTGEGADSAFDQLNF